MEQKKIFAWYTRNCRYMLTVIRIYEVCANENDHKEQKQRKKEKNAQIGKNAESKRA